MRFSETQLKKYKERLYHASRGGPAASTPTCRECTPGNVVELKCTGCLVTKSLDLFAAAQRRKPDEAKCTNCMQETLDRVPDLEEAAEEERIREARRSHASSSLPPLSNEASAVASRSGPASGSELRSQPYSVNANGVLIAPDHESAWGGKTPTHRSSSPTNTTVSEDDYHLRGQSNPGTNSIHSSRPPARSGFIKQGAAKTSVLQRVENREQREQRQMQECQGATAHDDDDDDDEWEL